jgi:RNA polymerase sigma-70 factor (ECF subfamily)
LKKSDNRPIAGKRRATDNLSGYSAMLVDPRQWIDEYGDSLYEYALLRVGNTGIAEKLLQKTLMSGLETRNRMTERVSERTWLVGILRQQIIEYFQSVNRLQPFDQKVVHDNSKEEFFSREGKWMEVPASWPSGSEGHRYKSFANAIHGCLKKMPDHLAQAIILRELEGLETKKIAAIMGISRTGIRKMLFRARLHFRRCLDEKFFCDPKKEKDG